MNIDDPSSWTQDEFEAFVMLIAASTDLEIVPEEKKPIREKAGDSWNDLINAFRGMNDAERLELVYRHKDQFLKTPEDHARIKREVHEVFMADEHFTSIEMGMESILKKIL